MTFNPIFEIFALLHILPITYFANKGKIYVLPIILCRQNEDFGLIGKIWYRQKVTT